MGRQEIAKNLAAEICGLSLAFNLSAALALHHSATEPNTAAADGNGDAETDYCAV